MPIRVWTTNRNGQVDKDSKEYRYCEKCTTGQEYFYCESYNEIMYKCSQQCDECKNKNY